MATTVLLLLLTCLAAGGRAEVAVQLFEWRFDDIAQECTDFLSKHGYTAIQTSPVNEYPQIPNRPWWERYQPFSYRIISRSGDENAFRSMVRTCNQVGVKVYVDVILNHMSASLAGGTVGTGGSRPDTGGRYYPEVPYGPNDFHHPCSINNWNDPWQIRNCELVGLHDLNQSSEYVKSKLVEFLNKLVNIGVAGFRVDAAKHIDVGDLQAIMSRVNNLNTEFFPPNTRPFVYQEIAGSETDVIKPSHYFGIGSSLDFKYGSEVSRAMHKQNQLKWFRTFGQSWGLLPWHKSVVFIDNHDTQRDGVFGSMPVTYKESKLYKMANGWMLAWPHEVAKVMSSFDFNDKNQGPPADGSGNIRRIERRSDLSCGGGWVCEHRWRQIFSMVQFANITKGTDVREWWDNGNYQVAFCRGNKGFFAINNDNYDLHADLQTCLPPGDYCDVISGSRQGNSCTGKRVTVRGDGKATISIPVNQEDGIFAIHLQSRVH